MSLPDDEVMDLLQDQFVVIWRNIEKDEHVGLSHGYRRDQTAVGTTNGAGGRNVQIVVLAYDETVLHVLPGFWHPEDLARELRFARTLHELWRDETRTLEQKQRMYVAMHAAHVRGFSADTIARSDWQGFDRWEEQQRMQQGAVRDTAVLGFDGQPRTGKQGIELKPLCTLVHERMLARPFRKLQAFDFESFVDYGRAFYDNNAGTDKGKSFPKAEHANDERAREQAKAEAEAAKAAKAGKTGAKGKPKA